MNKFFRKIAVLTGALAVSVGLMATVAVPAEASTHVVTHRRDSGWP